MSVQRAEPSQESVWVDPLPDDDPESDTEPDSKPPRERSTELRRAGPAARHATARTSPL